VLRRYALPCLGIAVLALAISLVLYKAASTTFNGTCVIEVSLPPTEQKLGSDFFAFNARLTSDVVVEALNSRVYDETARVENVDAIDLSRHTTIETAGQSFAKVTVNDNDTARAARLANDICNRLVGQIRALLDARQANAASLTADRIGQVSGERNAIAAIDPAKRTPAQQATLVADDTALSSLRDQLALILGLPPDLVDVAGTAQAGVKADTPDLGRDLVIGLIAAVLACFLVILAGEIIADRGRSI
jgi:hypothetical protein